MVTETTRFFAPALLLIGLLLGTSAPGCHDYPCDEGNEDLLIRHWELANPVGDLHERIFRPAGSQDVPATHFHQEYIFRADGTCSFTVLSPVDRHYWGEGTWKRDDRDRSIVHVSSPDGDFSFQILELDSTILRIRGIE